MREWFKFWWPLLVMGTLAVAVLWFAIAVNVTTSNERRDKCQAVNGILLSPGKGEASKCIVGQGLKEVDLK